MKIYERQTINLAEEKANEKNRADIARQQATLEYLAAMTDIELPDEGAGEEGGEDIE